MKLRPIIVPALVVLAVAAVVTSAARSPVEPVPEAGLPAESSRFVDAVGRVNGFFAADWQEKGLVPAAAADELLVLRRLSLALHGTIPSLEEIRDFEKDERPDRLERWTARMLEDNRFADYFAERLARAFVGVEQGPFIVFRRGRFVGWLSDQLQQNMPYNDIVRSMISQTGLWTGKPAANFVTVGFANDELDENKLAGRSVRAFLGQRIDCAQCHDHPFDDWKQHQFEGLAAHFSEVKLSVVGVEDRSSLLFDVPLSFQAELDRGEISKDLRRLFGKGKQELDDRDRVEVIDDSQSWSITRTRNDAAEADAEKPASMVKYVIRSEAGRLNVYDGEREYRVQDRNTLADRVVRPAVPFHPEWLPAEGTHRERLAGWVTHSNNRRFERSIANRVWGLLFGVPYVAPVDDLPDPDDSGKPDLLDILGSDFREHGYDLRRLIQVIAASQPFRVESIQPLEEKLEALLSETGSEIGTETSRSKSHDEDPERRLAELRIRVHEHKSAFAVFPLTRARPEQVIGSMLQASSIKTIDQNSHLLFRTVKLFRTNDFLKEYGDLGEGELEARSGTIPQALLRMNGNLSRELLEAPLSSAARIASMASTDESCLETCYLVCVSRRPTEPEREHFAGLLRQSTGEKRAKVVQDTFWSLFNSPEFSWDH